MFNRLRKHAVPAGLILLIVLNLLVWSAVIIEAPKRYVEVAFLDVGQGDSILVTSPWGNQVLIDGGPDKTVLRRLSEVMPWYDRSIDVVLATHPDADHTGGLIDVLKRYKVGAFLEPGVSSDTAIYKELQVTKEKRQIPSFLARKGMIVSLDEGTYMEILFPDRDVTDFETNTASIVARVVYGEQSFILTGDSPQSIEEYLVALYGGALEANVLKAGHHGSNTSSSEMFLSVVSPEIAVISAGKNNRYGHPHQEVLDRFGALGAEILDIRNSSTVKLHGYGAGDIVKK